MARQKPSPSAPDERSDMRRKVAVSDDWQASPPVTREEVALLRTHFGAILAEMLAPEGR